MNIGAAIYKILSDDTAVASLVATRISPNVMNQTQTFPFIVYDVTNDNPDDIKDGVSPLDSFDVMVSGYSKSYKKASVLANYIRTALDRKSGNYNGVEIQSIEFENFDDIFDDDSGSEGVYRKALNFKVRVTNAINNIYSLNFDGVDDYVDIGAGVIDKDEGTYSLWAKLDETSSNGTLIRFGADSDNYVQILYANGSSQLRMTYKAAGGTKNATATDAIEGDGKWHHIAGVWSQSSDHIKIYIDGVLKDTTSGLETFAGSPTEGNIGSNTEGGNYFEGYIDEESIYNTELSADTIKNTLYNDGFPNAVGGISGLLGYWKMGDGATYPTIPDDSSYSNNGTMTNMASDDIVADVPDGS